MMRNDLAAIATVAMISIAIDTRPLQAIPVTYDFTVEVTQGTLAGNTFSGSLTYDDEAIMGIGTEEIGVENSLTVTMEFLGQTYSEISDSQYPEFPKLRFEDGEIQQLDFWIEPGERLIWWNLPGWEIDLSRQHNAVQVR